MSFRWTWEDGASDAFETKEAAEEWMGAEWKRLLDSGVLDATLRDDDEPLYRMRLTAD